MKLVMFDPVVVAKVNKLLLTDKNFSTEVF